MEIIADRLGNAISDAFRQARKGLICSPYYTNDGFTYIGDFLKKGEYIEFWTRLNIIDWASGFADLPELVEILLNFQKRGADASLYIHDNLHAKLYIADERTCLLGSANLTARALNTNVELLLKFDADEVGGFTNIVNDVRSKMVPIGTEEIAAYVNTAAEAVSGLKKTEIDLESDEAKDLNAAIELAEEIIVSAIAKTTGRTGKEVDIDRQLTGLPTLSDFITYCKGIKDKDNDARETVERHNGKHNLQGHVKHSYYGAVLFLANNNDVIEKASLWDDGAPVNLKGEPWLNSFRNLLIENINYYNERLKFHFRTLRTYLPESIGGTTTGGGGGISTFRRVMRLTAKMISERRKTGG